MAPFDPSLLLAVAPSAAIGGRSASVRYRSASRRASPISREHTSIICKRSLDWRGYARDWIREVTRGPDDHCIARPKAQSRHCSHCGGRLRGTRPALCLPRLSLTRRQEILTLGKLRPGSGYAAQFPKQRPMPGARIPTLAEVIALVRKSGDEHVRLNIETKIDPTRP